MTTQHEMLGAVGNTGIPVQQSHQVPVHNPNNQNAGGRYQGFGVAAQQNYDNMHGQMQEPVVQQPQQVPQQPQWAGAPQHQYYNNQQAPQQQPAQPAPQPQQVPQPQPQPPVQQQPDQPSHGEDNLNAVPPVDPQQPVELTEEEKQKIQDEGEQKKEEIKEETPDDKSGDSVNSYYETLIEKMIDEEQQHKIEALKYQKEAEFLQKQNMELKDKLNEAVYNSDSISVHEQ